ncbi:MAG: UDP-N-acetylglucosamine--N-acetylmuramyl-(pentapeptide) pyrophosphoryl-undecaprenol N-acetylglucosamine transferase [Phycisphaeraceae bacterium]|nr:UDP-N-acetylglucosamine--N-acetylmuramyl-(pentapeptide) pyrophosphoryl-undecaprenol N-acetylglucosamine transferase [Phycisphaeraceae bacterium]
MNGPAASSAGPDVFIFAGGGTGGHLYPGLAIAQELRALAASSGRAIDCLFVCSDRPIDERILADAGERFRPIAARPVGLRPATLVRFLRAWGRAVADCRAIVRESRARAGSGRVVMVAMGGFVAAPAAMAARRERLPLTMINLDAVPGKANRWIARRAGRVISTYPVAGRPDWTIIPPIVRRDALTSDSRQDCRRAEGLDPDRPTLMVTGGSQGALTVNQTVAAVARSGALAGWQVLHQCGAADAGSGGSRDELIATYRDAGVPAVVAEFTRNMGRWWGAADLAVSRAGANSVAEAWANRVPAVFMPYPFHRDQHQRLNAIVLEQAGAAVIATDAVDPAANAAGAAQIIARLLRDPGALAAMRSALDRLGPADGAARAARAIWA